MVWIAGWTSRLGALAIGGLMALSAGEVAVRVFVPQPVTKISSGLYEPVDDLRFRMRPSAEGEIANGAEFETRVSIDRHGLRTTRRSPAPPSARRILFLGDSFTFGWGVDDLEAFPALVGRQLTREGAETWAMNAGVPGYGVPDEALWLERYGLPLEPDAVVLCIFLANDLLDATPERRRESLQTALPEVGSATGVYRWLFGHSHLVRLGGRAVPWSAREALGLPQPWAIRYLREMFETHANDPGPLAAIGRRESRVAVARIVEASRARGVPVTAVLIPARFQLDPAGWNLLTGLLGLEHASESGTIEPEVPARWFREVLAELEVPTLDLSPTLGQALETSDEDLYFRFDPHWTAAGHRLAADRIAPFLARHLRPEQRTSADSAGAAQSQTQRVPGTS